MKKYTLYLWLIALVGLITSCSKDDTADTLQTDEPGNRVSLTAALPADFATPGTRALPTALDGYKLRCILEVWDKDLTTLKVRKEVCPDAGAGNLTFSFELADPGEYKALLWADYIDSDASTSSVTIAGLDGVAHYPDLFYKTNGDTGLRAVKNNTGGISAANDAFCAAEGFTKAAAALKDLTVTLSRPLTRLTLAEKDAENFAILERIKLTYSVPDCLNVATGEVSESKEFNADSKQAGAYGSGKDITINGIACKTLYTAYFFAAPDGTMGEIKLECGTTDESGKTFRAVTIPAGIPARRNYCVNAAGHLLIPEDAPSPAVQMTVDVNSNWTLPDEEVEIPELVWDGTTTAQPAGYDAANPGTVNITSAAELAWIAATCSSSTPFTGYTFRLTADIDLNNHEWKPIGAADYPFKGTFDGNNHTVSRLKCTTSNYAGLFGLLNGATVKDVTVSGSVSYAGTGNVALLGGIAGQILNGSITGCTNQCNVSVAGNNCTGYVGGIVGNATCQSNGNGTSITFSGNTNTGTVTSTNQNSFVGGILGYASATNAGTSVTLTDNTYNGGTPSDVCIGYCSLSNGTITVNGTTVTHDKPYPVPQTN